MGNGRDFFYFYLRSYFSRDRRDYYDLRDFRDYHDLYNRDFFFIILIISIKVKLIIFILIVISFIIMIIRFNNINIDTRVLNISVYLNFIIANNIDTD